MIYTFYSYKGGAGRSMAVANVGELFYQAGLNVLLVDWDLEAPGLERFFALENEQTAAHLGVIDMLSDYKQQRKQNQTTKTRQFPFKKPFDYIIDLYSDPRGGKLSLLTAGRRGADNFRNYASSVLTFDWEEFYDYHEGETYFELLRQQFLGTFDVILIDSRTGITEMGGVCTYQLADVVVMFCGTSEQSLDGTARMVMELTSSGLEKARGRPLEVVVVPTRVDDDSRARPEFRDEFLKRFAQYTPAIFKRNSDYFWQLEIPYVTVCAYKEMIVTPNAADGSEKVFKAFAQLAFALSRLASDSSVIRKIQLERGNIIGDDVVLGGHSHYQISTPQPVDKQTLDAARERLAGLPLDYVPNPAPLPQGSRMPLRANPLFVGREDVLKGLAAMLKGGQTAAIGQIGAIAGLGGIGKTQLASEFAHRYGQFFAGGVFWLSFADPQSVPAEIAACGGLGAVDLRPDFGNLPLEDQVRLVLSAWCGPLPRLLIFDNCEDEDLLARWLPPSGGARVLVTSRRGRWNPELGVTALRLDVLPRPESVALLRKHRPDLSDADADAIAQELGDLPLALHVAGSFLATYRRAAFGAPQTYLADLRREGLAHASLAIDQRSYATDHELHVARTFDPSYQRLDPADPTDAVARALLARSAYFAPGIPIPRDLLLHTLEAPEADFEAARQAEDGLARLVALGLWELEGETRPVLHRLLATFVRQAVADEAAPVAVEETVLTSANRLNNAGYPAPLLAWQPHLRFVTDAAQAREDERAAGLCNALGYHLQTTGDYPGARPYYERALAINEAALGPDHPNTATSLNNLGALLDSMGDLAGARPYYERALAINEAALGPDHPDTAQSFNNIGMLLKATGDLTSARSYFERALAINEAALGPDHPDTAVCLNNLGGILQATGDLTSARSYFERALAIWEAALGPDHPDTAICLNNLGGILQTMGDLAGARAYYERALAIRDGVLGSYHPDTARSLNNLGGVLQAMGDLISARSYYERALAIYEAVLGPDHPDTATCLHNLAVLCYHAGIFDEAAHLMNRALVIWKAKIGPDHPNTQIARQSLAAIEERLRAEKA